MENLTGQCLCGSIAYEIEGGIGIIVNCHCSKCRQTISTVQAQSEYQT